jgi:cysteinyl-tRNA synthetase
MNSGFAAAPLQGLGFGSVDSWVYQLQNYENDDLTALGNFPADVVVMDYSVDGSESGRFSRDQINALKNSPTGSKKVLAYLSIGEASNFRYYFPDCCDRDGDLVPGPNAPRFIGPLNPEFPESFKVRFWDDDWQKILFNQNLDGYLDRIIDAGFDGVYMDVIDAYEFWETQSPPESSNSGVLAREDMVELVKRIAYHARVTRNVPNFLVVPQNGDPLARFPDYIAVVDGIARESLFTNINDPQDQEGTDEGIENLNLFKAAGKAVFVIDYPTEPSLREEFYRKARALGYIPYVTTRALDTLTPILPPPATSSLGTLIQTLLNTTVKDTPEGRLRILFDFFKIFLPLL